MLRLGSHNRYLCIQSHLDLSSLFVPVFSRPKKDLCTKNCTELVLGFSHTVSMQCHICVSMRKNLNRSSASKIPSSFSTGWLMSLHHFPVVLSGRTYVALIPSSQSDNLYLPPIAVRILSAILCVVQEETQGCVQTERRSIGICILVGTPRSLDFDRVLEIRQIEEIKPE